MTISYKDEVVSSSLFLRNLCFRVAVVVGNYVERAFSEPHVRDDKIVKLDVLVNTLAIFAAYSVTEVWYL